MTDTVLSRKRKFDDSDSDDIAVPALKVMIFDQQDDPGDLVIDMPSEAGQTISFPKSDHTSAFSTAGLYSTPKVGPTHSTNSNSTMVQTAIKHFLHEIQDDINIEVNKGKSSPYHGHHQQKDIPHQTRRKQKRKSKNNISGVKRSLRHKSLEHMRGQRDIRTTPTTGIFRPFEHDPHPVINNTNKLCMPHVSCYTNTVYYYPASYYYNHYYVHPSYTPLYC